MNRYVKNLWGCIAAILILGVSGCNMEQLYEEKEEQQLIDS